MMKEKQVKIEVTQDQRTWIMKTQRADPTHTCQVLRFGRSPYGFVDKLKTTGVVGKDYGFRLVWRSIFFGNDFITFDLFLDEVMGLSQYC